MSSTKKTINLLAAFCLTFSASLPLKAQNAYWQQEVNYKIEANLDDKNHILKAKMSIDYKNNSPQSLDTLVFHLWANAYQKRGTAFDRQKRHQNDSEFYHSKKNQRGGYQEISFKTSNGTPIQWFYDKKHADIAYLVLDRSLSSQASTQIDVTYELKIPDSFSRLGHADNAYQFTQWYPKPAVFDAQGWHPMPYLDQGEFYSEFGSFDVTLTLPANYVVAATGELQTASEIEWLDKLALQGETSVQAGFPDRKAHTEFPTSLPIDKTIRYVQDRVHDFAWFADKRFYVLKGSIKLPHSQQEVTSWAMFTGEEAPLWAKSIEYINQATYYYSLWNGDYPYKHVTALEGSLSAGAGMEYPMVTIIGKSGNAFSLDVVIAHEVGHNWFYGILGSNERDFPYLDEGLNSYNEMRYVRQRYPEKLLGGSMLPEGFEDLLWASGMENAKEKEYLYAFMAARNMDQPCKHHSDAYNGTNYGAMVYSKTPVMLDYLANYLGQELFDRCMMAYYERWKFKHPQPDDLQAVFEEVTGKKLDWFFDRLISRTDKLDFAVKGYRKKDHTVKIRNKSKVEAPLTVYLCDKDLAPIDSVVVEGFLGSQRVQVPEAGKKDAFVIDYYYKIPEINRNNNVSKASGIMRNCEPLKLGLLTRIEPREKTAVFIMPTFGYNTYDKFGLGLGIHNYSILGGRKFNYYIQPIYSIANNAFNGSALLTYHIMPSKFLASIDVDLLAQRFAALTKLSPSITFYTKPKNLLYAPRQELKIAFNQMYADSLVLPQYPDMYQIFSLDYSISKSEKIKSWAIRARGLVSPEKFSSAELEMSFNFQWHEKSFVRLRGFFGTFLNNNDLHPAFMFGMSGSTDFLAETNYIDRAFQTTSFYANRRQNDLRHGAFKATTYDFSDTWLATFNVMFDLTSKIGVYGDFGFNGSTDGLHWGSGLYFGGNASRLYIPFFGNHFAQNNSPDDIAHLFRGIRFSYSVSIKSLGELPRMIYKL